MTDTRKDGGRGCICRDCGRPYRIDVLLPDDLWNRIRPAGTAPGAGLLCGSCILFKLEGYGDFAAFRLIAVDERHKGSRL